jgi:hypothetical protein
MTINRYTPFHIYKWITDIPREIKWAYQRVTRGWSDRDVWSMDYHLSNILVGMLRRLKETKHGVPLDFCGDWGEKTSTHFLPMEESIKLWDACLDEMIEGFEARGEMDELTYPTSCGKEEKKVWEHNMALLSARKERALALFAKHFDSLWD